MADPEAFYYAARHVAHLGQPVLALEALTKSIRGGYFCCEPLTEAPWFESVRAERECQAFIAQALEGHESAVAAPCGPAPGHC